MNDKLYEVCELTPEQQKAFNKLKKAYKDCEKLGVYFVNIYGSLTAFDKKKVAGYGDKDLRPGGVYDIELLHGCPAESFKISNEWSDDCHVLGLTPKGKKIYLDE